MWQLSATGRRVWAILARTSARHTFPDVGAGPSTSFYVPPTPFIPLSSTSTPSFVSHASIYSPLGILNGAAFGRLSRESFPLLSHHHHHRHHRASHHYAHQPSGLAFLTRLESAAADTWSRLRPHTPFPGLTLESLKLLPVRVLRSELQTARVGAPSSLRKPDLVTRLWGLTQLAQTNRHVVDSLGVLPQGSTGPVRWAHLRESLHEDDDDDDDEDDDGRRVSTTAPGSPGSPLSPPSTSPSSASTTTTTPATSFTPTIPAARAAPAPPSPPAASTRASHGPLPSGLDLVEASASFLRRAHCRDLLVIDMRPVARWTDYMVLATSLNEAHTWRVARGLLYQLKRDDPGRPWGQTLIDGGSGSDWVHVEFPDRCVIHVMTEEARRRTDLESLWIDADKCNAHVLREEEEEREQENRKDGTRRGVYTLDQLSA